MSTSYAMDNDDYNCEICSLPEPLVFAPCNHSACLKCMERICLSKSEHHTRRFDDDNDDESVVEDKIIASCPSRGRCPFCRKCFDIFNLKYLQSNSYVYEKKIKIEDTSLKGLKFSDKKVNNEKMISFENKPEISIYRQINGDREHIATRDFNIAFHYHEKYKIFSGTIDWEKSEEALAEGKYKQWEVIMQFSSDFRYVQRGSIIKTPNNDITSTPEYPMDGEWLVTWQNSGRDSGSVASINVIENSFSCFGITYHLKYESNVVYFDWPTHPGVRQVVESGVDLSRKPSGPDIDSIVVWTFIDPGPQRIVWKRKSNQRTVVDLRGYTFSNISSERRQMEKPVYVPTTPWGNTFIQAYTVGLASYHFISSTGEGEDGAYISYEHERCSSWPPFDNGLTVPSRVPFADLSYDEETRTFRGKIPWMEVYGTTWQGDSEWNYEIIFDSKFTCIKAGTVSVASFIHSYGESLNYVNAALIEMIRLEAFHQLDDDGNGATLNEETETDDNLNHDQNNRVRASIAKVTNELRNEDIPVRTLSMVQRVCQGAIHPELDPIDYNMD
mmetsp:Transcript_21083/g.25917  ORF Transcript_21083/g.25917 Transcript_21083/m.25917 type:complete len:557 (-) Transcript_21083:371-2041(-)